MEDLLRLAGMIICAAVVVDLLKRYSAGYAILASLACCMIVLSMISKMLVPVFTQLSNLLEQLNTQGFTAVLKACAIALIAQTVQDLCQEAGQPALAGRVDLAARVMILATALPLITQMAQVIKNLLSLS